MKSSRSVLLKSLLLLSVAGAAAGLASNGLIPQMYLPLPMGDVKPSGWLLEQLDPKSRGTKLGKDAGFYQYLAHANMEWTSRPIDTHTIEGAGSHWFRDMVTVAAVLDVPVLQSQTEQFLDYFLDTQGEDGWLGPEVNSTKPRDLSARLPFLRGAIRVAEAHPARAARIVTALHRFVALAYEVLVRSGGLGDDNAAYAGDLLVVLQWLYDFHPDGREDALLETMRMLSSPQDDASAHIFREENVPVASAGSAGVLPDVGTMWRAMNTAKALTTLGATYRLRVGGAGFGGDALSDSWDALFAKRGQPFGLLVPDTGEFRYERTQGHIAAETLRSALYLHQVTGDPKYAEQADRMLFNAMSASVFFNPAAFTWGTTCSLWLCRGTYSVDGPYYDLFKNKDKDVSCCTVLYPEGAPDYVHSAFLATADRKSLVHAHLGPFTVNTTLANDNKVAVTVDTTYPHGSNASFTTTIVAQSPFDYYVRIPTWSGKAVISFGNGSTEVCKPVTGLYQIHVHPGTTKFKLAFDLPITADLRPSGLVSVHRGPLLFVFESFAQPGGEEPHRRLQYAIDPSTLALSTTRPPFFFGPQTGFYTLSVAACPVYESTGGNEWERGVFPELEPGLARCVGPVRNLTLTSYKMSHFPYAAVKEFPTFSLANVGGTVAVSDSSEKLNVELTMLMSLGF